MAKEVYKQMHNRIEPHRDLIQRTKMSVKNELAKCSVPRRGFVRWPAALIAICLCLAITVPVAGATVPAFNDLLYFVAPEVAQFLRPVEMFSADQGIEMKVIAVMNDDEDCVVYLTLRDSTGNRVDQTVDLYNYGVRGCTCFTHRLLHYNEDTRTATICLMGGGGRRLSGKKVTVQVDSFLSNKVVHAGMPLDIGVQEAGECLSPATMEIASRNVLGGARSGDGRVPGWREGAIVVLRPGNQPVATAKDIDFVSVSAVGQIGGLLHVQTVWNPSVDNHGDIYFVGEDGTTVMSCGNLCFVLDEDRSAAPYGTKFVEYAFEIPESDLSKYAAYGDFTENKCYTQGNWKVTFKMDPVDDQKIIKTNVDVDGFVMDKIGVSLLGVDLESQDIQIGDMDLQLLMTNGEVIDFGFARFVVEGKTVRAKYFPNNPIVLERISGIRINDVLVPIE